LLSAPIILYDYPEIAPESPGDLFDGAEIDEILTLRIVTLTDEEKRAMAAVDDRARALLARTESLTPEQLWKLHGTVRGLQAINVDKALEGQTATIQGSEQDYEDRVYLSVTVDDDPGRDFGEQGKPAHRFFFRPDEVEPLGDQPGREG